MTGLEENYLTALTLWPTLLNPSREGGRSTLTSGNPANGLHTTRIGKLPFRTYRLKLVSHNVSATNLINNIAEKAEKVKLDICPLIGRWPPVVTGEMRPQPVIRNLEYLDYNQYSLKAQNQMRHCKPPIFNYTK
jgi:hypothetical protein